MKDKLLIIGLIALLSIVIVATAVRTDYNPDRSTVEMWIFNYTDDVPLGQNIVVGLRMKATETRYGKIELFDDRNMFASFDVVIDRPRHFDIEFPAVYRGEHLIKLQYFEGNLTGKGSPNNPYYITVRVNVI